MSIGSNKMAIKTKGGGPGGTEFLIIETIEQPTLWLCIFSVAA
jgi:hypothetical protein